MANIGPRERTTIIVKPKREPVPEKLPMPEVSPKKPEKELVPA